MRKPQVLLCGLFLLIAGCSMTPDEVLHDINVTVQGYENYLQRGKEHPLGSYFDYDIENFSHGNPSVYNLQVAEDSTITEYKLPKTESKGLYTIPAMEESMVNAETTQTISGKSTVEMALGSSPALEVVRSSSKLKFPYQTATQISSFFGWRNISGGSGFHQGVDLLNTGSSHRAIYTSGTGRVMEVGDCGVNKDGYTADGKSKGGGWGVWVAIQYEIKTIADGVSGNNITLSEELDRIADLNPSRGNSNIEREQLSEALKKASSVSKQVQDEYALSQISNYMSICKQMYPNLSDVRSYALLCDAIVMKGDSIAGLRSANQSIMGTSGEYEEILRTLKATGSDLSGRSTNMDSLIKSSNLTGSDVSNSKQNIYSLIAKNVTGKDLSSSEPYSRVIIDHKTNKLAFGVLEFTGTDMTMLLSKMSSSLRGSSSNDSEKSEDMIICLLYAHMERGSVTVKKGQVVKEGEVIGVEGNTGASMGKHLHLGATVGRAFKTSDFAGSNAPTSTSSLDGLITVDPLKDVFDVENTAQAQEKLGVSLTCPGLAKGQKEPTLDSQRININNVNWATVQKWE